MEKKGVTIEINVDTSKFDKRIKEINKDIKKTDSELKKVDKSLKFNPTNVELWRQKQTLLTQKIADTTKKLDELKSKQAAMDAAGVDKNSEEYRKLQREIVETKSKLKHFKKELLKVGNAKLTALGEQFKRIGKKAEELGKTLTRKVTAPIVAAYGAAAKASLEFGDAIAKVSTIADETQVPIETLKKDIISLSNETGKSSTELAEAAYQALSASVETKDVSTFLRDATGLAKAGFLETADAVDVLTTIINAYGYEASDANKIASELVQTQNDGKTTVNELASAMGTVIPTASALNIPLEQLNASYVLMTKQGINTANATTYLNGMFTELADNGSDVSEILQNKTGKTFGQLMKEGATLGDVLEMLNESVDGDSEAFLNLWGNTRAGRGALSLLNGGVEEFNAETKIMESSTDNVGDALEKLKTPGAEARKALNMLVNAGIQVGDVLAPAIEKVATFIQSLLEKFNNLSPEAKKIIVTIGAIVAAIGPALLIGGKLLQGIGSLITGAGRIISLIQMLIPAITTVLGIIGTSGAIFLGVAAAIMALALIIYKNWDKIKAWAINLKDSVSKAFTQLKQNAVNQINAMKADLIAKWNALKTAASNAFNNIKSAIVKPIQNAVETVKQWIEKIKSFFPINIGNIFKNMKLPHFSLDWGSKDFGKLGTIKYPKGFNVNWYKQGGIFDNPSLIGVGEAGPEAVIPLDKLWKKLDAIAESGGGSPTINVYARDGQSAKEIAQEVYKIIVQQTRREATAWQ